MGISKTYRKKSYPVMWDGEKIADVSHLNADAFVSILSNVAADLGTAFTTFEEAQFSIKGKTAEEIADFILSDGPAMLQKFGTAIPELLIEVIVHGAGEEGDSEIRDVVRYEWSAPAQIEAVAQVLRATFVDEAALRALVGNVMALLQSANALTSNAAKTRMPTSPVQPSLEDG